MGPGKGRERYFRMYQARRGAHGFFFHQKAGVIHKRISLNARQVVALGKVPWDPEALA